MDTLAWNVDVAAYTSSLRILPITAVAITCTTLLVVWLREAQGWSLQLKLPSKAAQHLPSWKSSRPQRRGRTPRRSFRRSGSRSECRAAGPAKPYLVGQARATDGGPIEGAAYGEKAFIIATAAAYPKYEYSQAELLDEFLKRHPLNPSDEEFAQRIFRRTEIERATIALPREDLYRKMSRSQYVEHMRTNVLDLGLRAAEQALNAWGGERESITHIVFGTMSVVMDTPTTDVRLINELRLSPFTKRLCVQQMGCLTGFKLLSLAASIAKESSAHRVLVVCADVRSGLGNQLQIPSGEPGVVDFPRSSIVACALFRDAGGACIVGTHPGLSPGEAAPKCEILAHESYVIPGTGDMVRITEGDDAVIHWHNDTGLPQAVAENAPLLVERLGATLQRESGVQLNARDVPWCVHTGGPKVLRMVAESVGLSKAHLATSWEYLRSHGNTTGASNITILHHFFTREQGKEEPSGKQPGDLAILLGIGPGLAMESLVVRNATA